MVRSYIFRSTSVPAAGYGDEVFDVTIPSHLSKAREAISHLDHLSHQSRRHDQTIMDEVNARALTSSLAPRVIRRHHHIPSATHHHHIPSATHHHVSRRVGHSGGGFVNRDLSVPPLSDSISHSYGNEYTLGATKRTSLAAETAVRQAHREVDRVERELSFSHQDPVSSRRQRSFSMAAPSRATSVYHEPLTSHHSHTMSAASHHLPSHSYRYESCHPDHTRRDYNNYTSNTYHSGRMSPNYELEFQAESIHKPLYSPLKLIRCLTDTNPPSSHHHHSSAVHEPFLMRSRSAHPLQSSHHHHSTYLPTPHYHSTYIPTPHYHSTYIPTPHYHTTHHTHHTAPLLTRSQSLHRPHKPSSLLLPDSVGQWYNKPLSPSHHYSSSSLAPTLSPVVSRKSKTLSYAPALGNLFNHYYHSTPSPTSDLRLSLNLGHHSDFNPHYLGDTSHHHLGDTSHHHLGDISHHHLGDTSHHHLGDISHHHLGDTSHHHLGDTSHHHLGDISHHHLGDTSHHQLHHDVTHTPSHHHHHLSTTYSSLPPRPHIVPLDTYVAKAATLASPTTYLHTGLERPLESHRDVSETRQRVRDVLCRTTEKVHFA